MSDTTFTTSRDAFNWCRENNLISLRVADVLKVLVESDRPMNQTMAHNAVVTATGNVALQKYSVSPRFAVLERMGLIREVGTQACPVSGRATVFYEPTCARPKMTEAEAMKAVKSRETMGQLKKQLKDVTEERDQLRELLNLRSASHAVQQKRIKEAKVPVQTSLF